MAAAAAAVEARRLRLVSALGRLRDDCMRAGGPAAVRDAMSTLEGILERAAAPNAEPRHRQIRTGNAVFASRTCGSPAVAEFLAAGGWVAGKAGEGDRLVFGLDWAAMWVAREVLRKEEGGRG